MTSGIDTSARIASMFRSALAAQKAKVGAREPVGKTAAAAPRSPADLSGLIASRVSAVPVDDPERKSKVFRAFLEAMLVAELGERLLVDPAFATMVDAVQCQMQEDPQIAAAVDQAVQALLAPPSSGS